MHGDGVAGAGLAHAGVGLEVFGCDFRCGGEEGEEEGEEEEVGDGRVHCCWVSFFFFFEGVGRGAGGGCGEERLL